MLFGLCAGFLVTTFFVQQVDESLLQRGRREIDEGRPQSAAILFKQALEGTTGSTFALRIALATAYLESGEIRLAEENLSELNKQLMGTRDDLPLAVLANTWGGVHLKEGRYAQAREEFAGALRRVSDNPNVARLVATLLDNLAAVEVHLHLYPEALSHQQDAITRWQASTLPEPDKLIKAYIALAAIQYQSNDLESSNDSIALALNSARATFGDKNPRIAALLERRSIILKRLGRKQEAKAAHAEARKIGPLNQDSASQTYTVDIKALRSGQ